MLPRHHKPLVICVGIFTAAHLVILALPLNLQWFNHTSRKPEQKPISVRLRLDSTPQVREKVSEAESEKVEPQSETHPQEEPAERLVRLDEQDLPPPEAVQETQPEPKRFERRALIAGVKAALATEEPAPDRFGVRQSMTQNTQTSFARPSELPQLLTSARGKTGFSYAGQATDLERGANGEAMCWQQRGIPGESEQWYRVPLALCGHLD